MHYIYVYAAVRKKDQSVRKKFLSNAIEDGSIIYIITYNNLYIITVTVRQD
jgi:hypothetical protein